MDKNLIYKLGIRDTIANLFMEIILEGEKSVLVKYAKMLPENPHCVHYLELNE